MIKGVFQLLKKVVKIIISYYNYLFSKFENKVAFEPLKNNKNKNVCIILDKGLGDFILFSYYLKILVDNYESEGKQVLIVANKYSYEFIRKYRPELCNKTIILNESKYELLDGTPLIKYRHYFFYAICPMFYTTTEQCCILRALSPNVIYATGKSEFPISTSLNLLDEEVIKNIKTFDIGESFYANIHQKFVEQLLKRSCDLSLDSVGCQNKMLNTEYFVVNISGNDKRQLLGHDKFIALAGMIASFYNMKAIIIGGIDCDDKSGFYNEYLDYSFAKKQDLNQTISLCKYAKFVITSDTGIYHLGLSIEAQNPIIVFTWNKGSILFAPYPKILSKNRVNYYYYEKCQDCNYNKIWCYACCKLNKQVPCVKNADVEDMYKYVLKILES